MIAIQKVGALLFMLTLVTSALSVLEPASAISTPSIPEFTLRYIDNSYNVPTTYKTDEYTGQTVVNVTGYHVDNRSIEVTIKNQEVNFPSDGNDYFIFYNIRYKGHYGTNWTELYPLHTGYLSYYAYYEGNYSLYIGSENQICPEVVGSQSTIVSIPLFYDSNATVDVQVKAMVGHVSNQYVYNEFYPPAGRIESAIICDTTSDWSSTQTITLESRPDATSQPTNQPTSNKATSTQSPTETPAQPEGSLALTWKDIVIVVACAVIAALAAALVFSRRKKQ